VDEVNRALSQIDNTTQQNASTVEQLAGASDNLSMESRVLASTVERFRVSDPGSQEPTHEWKRSRLRGSPSRDHRHTPGRNEHDLFVGFRHQFEEL